MRGITREVKLDLVLQGNDTDPWGNERAGSEVQGSLNRKDFDMKFNQALGSGNLFVGDKVRISLDVSTTRRNSQRRDSGLRTTYEAAARRHGNRTTLAWGGQHSAEHPARGIVLVMFPRSLGRTNRRTSKTSSDNTPPPKPPSSR